MMDNFTSSALSKCNCCPCGCPNSDFIFSKQKEEICTRLITQQIDRIERDRDGDLGRLRLELYNLQQAKANARANFNAIQEKLLRGHIQKKRNQVHETWKQADREIAELVRCCPDTWKGWRVLMCERRRRVITSAAMVGRTVIGHFLRAFRDWYDCSRNPCCDMLKTVGHL